jgi:hypothetical protein
MYKRIVGFGDSWVWGDELIAPDLLHLPDVHACLDQNKTYREQNCFLGLLGQRLGLPTENLGWPGGSLQSTIWTYIWWLNNTDVNPTDCLILVGLTDAYRMSFYNPGHVSYADDPDWNKFVHSTWVHYSDSKFAEEWQQMVRLHTTLTDCEELHRLNYQQAVLFFDGQSQGNLFQFCTMRPEMHLTQASLLWPDTSLRNKVADPRLLAANGHPNELGHQFILDQLLVAIDSVKLVG